MHAAKRHYVNMTMPLSSSKMLGALDAKVIRAGAEMMRSFELYQKKKVFQKLVLLGGRVADELSPASSSLIPDGESSISSATRQVVVFSDAFFGELIQEDCALPPGFESVSEWFRSISLMGASKNLQENISKNGMERCFALQFFVLVSNFIGFVGLPPRPLMLAQSAVDVDVQQVVVPEVASLKQEQQQAHVSYEKITQTVVLSGGAKTVKYTIMHPLGVHAGSSSVQSALLRSREKKKALFFDRPAPFARRFENAEQITSILLTEYGDYYDWYFVEGMEQFSFTDQFRIFAQSALAIGAIGTSFHLMSAMKPVDSVVLEFAPIKGMWRSFYECSEDWRKDKYSWIGGNARQLHIHHKCLKAVPMYSEDGFDFTSRGGWRPALHASQWRQMNLVVVLILQRSFVTAAFHERSAVVLSCITTPACDVYNIILFVTQVTTVHFFLLFGSFGVLRFGNFRWRKAHMCTSWQCCCWAVFSRFSAD